MITTRILGAAALAASLAASACAPVAQGGANQPSARQQQGLMTGALLGGLLGAAVDDDNRARGAIVGAAGGALAGGAIGTYLDRQAADLRAAMASDEVIITNTGQELRVVMPEGILFDFDSANVRADLQRDIRALARNVITYRETTVDVVGHTDDTGSESYNMDLSTRRAAAVAGILLEEGVIPSRVRSYGRGELDPVASNATPEGRQQNRRVEVIIRPITN
ncbi:OmpA family protein [Rhodobacterales bacterium HKCCE2091]|nr:OmpA family protein [Rhodobacterales bacterium HKCCE2091]